jgi:rhodanese-related sulfurtransferase
MAPNLPEKSGGLPPARLADRLAGKNRPMTERVDAKQAQRLIADDILVVDVLPASVYEQEHLPGARNVALETFDPSQVASIDRKAALLVYCFDQH